MAAQSHQFHQPDLFQDQVAPGHSLQLKFAVSSMVIIALVLLILNTYPLIASQELVFKTKQTALQNEASVVSGNLSGLETLTSERVDRIMEVLGESNLDRVLVTDPEGMVLYDSTGEAEPGQYALLQEVVLALEGNDVFQSTFQSSVFRSSAASPIVYRNSTIGAVYLYEYDSEQGLLLTGLQNNLVRISAVVCVLSLLTSILLSVSMTSRLNSLLSAIRILREGEYSHRISIEGKDELAVLAGEFNRLTQRLEETDQVQRRFISDASHELKTPLAGIQLLSDSILQSEEMDPETMRDFVSDIGKEAARLNRITEHLLALSRMDNGRVVLHEPVRLEKTVEDVLRMLEPLADSRGITFEVEVQENCIVLGGEDDLYQVLFNLVENAIKYNLPAGLVRIILGKEESRVFLRVEDTGIGIPESEREKIFDRFYRVDKARSREAGGTGLGLSIVRDTVHLHGGWIGVGPRAGGGTWFQATFPAPEREVPAE
ncbi:MAG: HAMP domain-containing histidine kinase [Oscillospiraceae bacterium]|nr:HAMP domain-containing histidine kinase [Oscillospiraceae bacterium]